MVYRPKDNQVALDACVYQSDKILLVVDFTMEFNLITEQKDSLKHLQTFGTFKDFIKKIKKEKNEK